jgi:hypothetical protein
MSIHFNESTYWLQVHPGEDGLERFKGDVRKLLGLTDDQAFDITFECKVPGSGSRMELRGLSAFDAAVYCASITAAERVKTKAPGDGAAAGGAAGKTLDIAAAAGGAGGTRANSASSGGQPPLLGPALSSLPSTAIGVGSYHHERSGGSGSATDDDGASSEAAGLAAGSFRGIGSGSSSLPATAEAEEADEDGSGVSSADELPRAHHEEQAEMAAAAAAPAAPVAAPHRPSVTDKLLAPVRSWAMRLARPL